MNDKIKSGLIIGRWQPFHEGHAWLVKQVMAMGHRPCIGIRNTDIDKDNPFSTIERIRMIYEYFNHSQVDTIIVPDIAGIYYGRSVGYEVKELTPPDEILQISGSQIRDNMADRK